MPSKKFFSALISLGLLFVTACSSAPSKSFTTIQDFQTQQLNWKTCYEEFKCAELLVPIDYTDFKTGTFKLALLRYRVKDQQNRLGSIVVNPGGPGGSGVDYAASADYTFSPEVLKRYDIVGFDPRGVSRSAPIHCLTDTETDASYAADSKPDNAEELAAMVQDAKDFVAKCEKNTKHLTHYSSAESARDMDILRAALGDQKLNYVGKSYGTYLGTLYAQFFPDKVGRIVLDGAIDPNVPVAEQNLTQAIGFEGALYAFIDDCQTLPVCPLPKSDDAAKEELTKLFTSAATNPLPQKNSRDNRPVTESLMVLGTASALYDNLAGWPQLRKAIEEAQQGYGDTFIKLADIYSDRQSNGKYLTNQTDSGAVIDCLDWRSSRTDEQLQQDALLYKEKAPVLGPYLAYTGLTCQFFPTPKQDSLTRATSTIKEINTTPILIIGTKRDPATPYEWAVGLSKIIRGSILITLDADGHTGQGRGSECVDKAFDSYLISGKTPQGNISCTL